jgi:hypothetical protein
MVVRSALFSRSFSVGVVAALCVASWSCKSPPAPAPSAGSAAEGSAGGSAAGGAGSGSAAGSAAATPTPAPPAPARQAHAGKPLVRGDASAAVKCGKLAGPLAASLPVLAERMRLNAPAGALSSPRPWNAMSAPESDSVETRIMVGGGKSAGRGRDEALAIVVKELWQLDPDLSKAEPGATFQPKSFAEEAPKFLAAVFGDSEIEAVAVADPTIYAYAARPKKVELKEGADSALVLAMLLSSPDGTLQTATFHVSPALVKQAAGCTTLAEQIGASLSLGPRQLDRKAGTRELAGVGAAHRLTVDVPEDHIIIHQRAEDFDRHQIYKLRPLGLFPGDLLISIDAHPDRTMPPEALSSQPGLLLGVPVTWQGMRAPTGGYFAVTLPLPDVPGRFLQVVVRATREDKYLDEFRKVAETLKLEKK